MDNELRCDELTLGNRDTDFVTRFMAAAAIRKRIGQQPQLASHRTLTTLSTALTDPTVLAQRQALNLCREAAGALATIFISGPDAELAEGAVSILQKSVKQTYGAGHQAVTAALGSLPIPMHGPITTVDPDPLVEKVRFDQLVAATGKDLAGPITAAGRSLIAPLADSDRLLVVKLARSGDALHGLWQETAWLSNLEKILASCPADCHIPQPIRINGSSSFQVEKLPPVRTVALHPQKPAIAFVARRDYFTYPNGGEHQQVLAGEECGEVLQRSAKLLGWLAARGILHTAPIPLFHNRVQGERREDRGLYDWPLGGRLDQWLASCRHPNFGVSGLRDFEHLETIAGAGPHLHWHLGMHFFSLLLVAGSCFRFREPDKIGLDREGHPVDVRHLFPAGQLLNFINLIFAGYYEGFVGSPESPPVPFSLEKLESRMIEEMGVDTHMEELLRIRDQEPMSDEQFRDFLMTRGYTAVAADQVKRGAADLVLHTGPHLGGFNQRISLPELIEASAAMAAICVLDRYRATNGLKGCS
ncbi:MAG: SidJ-related pseudokinase [Deltaproteobacteria bacterium]